jgi:DNA replication protein DnaC
MRGNKNMSIKSDVIKSVIQGYEEKRAVNMRINAENRKILHDKYPELSAIDQKISSISVKACKDAISGNKAGLLPLDELLKPYHEKRINIIKSYNIPAQLLVPHFFCNDCHDTGFLDQKGNVHCHCFTSAYNKALSDIKGENENHQDECFDNFNLKLFSDDTSKMVSVGITSMTVRSNMERVLKAVQTFVNGLVLDKQYSNNFLISGPVGTGKSFLSHCIENALKTYNVDVLYFTSMDLFEYIKINIFSNTASSSDGSLSDLYDTRVLIIDDLGTEKATDFSVSQINDIIDKRLRKKLSTIITTNFSLTDIDKNYGSRIVSRINANFDLLKTFGDDLRNV